MDEEVPVQEEEEDVPTVIQEESSTPEDDASSPNSAREDEPSIGSVETVGDDEDQVIEPKPQPMAEEPPPQDQRPPAVRKLNSQLGGFWKDNLVGSVIHEHCIASMIKTFVMPKPYHPLHNIASQRE